MKLHRHLVLATVECLRSIFVDGHHADKAVEYTFRHHPKWGRRDRHFVASTIFEMVRWWRHLWALLGENPQAEESAINRVLALYLKKSGYDLPDWLPLNLSATELDLRVGRVRGERALWHSVPDWLDQLGVGEFGEAWEPILESLNQPASVVLRANRLKIKRDELRDKLLSEGIITHPVVELPDALILAERENIFRSQAFQVGECEVQDGSSQLIAPLLGVKPGMRVIDACAGAGGKTLHLAALMQNSGRIIALDVSEKKLAELKRRGRRSGVTNCETRVIESQKVIKRLHDSADRVLLDVPCSGLGVLRRNPDTKWKMNPERLAALKQIQQTLLRDYSRMVKRGGALVYATCSILPEENQQQIEHFLSLHPEWEFQEEVKIMPHLSPFDGFYGARLYRRT